MVICLIYYPQTSGGTGEGIVNVTIPSSVTLYIGGDNNNQTFTDEEKLPLEYGHLSKYHNDK